MDSADGPRVSPHTTPSNHAASQLAHPQPQLPQLSLPTQEISDAQHGREHRVLAGEVIPPSLPKSQHVAQYHPTSRWQEKQPGSQRNPHLSACKWVASCRCWNPGGWSLREGTGADEKGDMMTGGWWVQEQNGDKQNGAMSKTAHAS